MTSCADPGGQVHFPQPLFVRRRTVFHGLACAGALWLGTPSDLSCTVAFAVVLLGLTVRIWALSYICKDDEITATGPYAIVRHPLYVGNALMTIGLCLAANNVYATLVVVALLAPVYWATIRFEEWKLTERFGSGYTNYARRVPALVPLLRWPAQSLSLGARRRRPMKLLLHIAVTLVFLGLFVVKEDVVEYGSGVELATVWGLGIPHASSAAPGRDLGG